MQTSATSVETSIVVDAAIDRAFAVFTDGIGTWWPPDHHILEGDLDRMVFEPRAGGSVYDVATDGRECRWGTVLAYEPPTRVVIGWNVSVQWQLETDPARSSEVEIRFVAETANRTRVELEHRHLDRHGEGWEQMRDAVASPGGWPLGLGRFSERVRA